MPIISANTSTQVTLPAGKLLTGTGAGSAALGTAAQLGTQALTAGDAWQIGPFPSTQTIGITAYSAVSYEQEEPLTIPSPADRLTPAEVAAVQGLLAEGASVPKYFASIAAMLADTASPDGQLAMCAGLPSGVRGMFAWHDASGRWVPAGHVLVGRSLTLDSGVNSTAEQYIKSLYVPAGLLYVGAELLLEYTVARSNATDAGANGGFRVGNAGTIADATLGIGGSHLLTGSARSVGMGHRYRVVSATEIAKLGTATTGSSSFTSGATSTAVSDVSVGSTTADLHFAPTVQLAAATGTTLPQVGYMALWMLPG